MAAITIEIRKLPAERTIAMRFRFAASAIASAAALSLAFSGYATAAEGSFVYRYDQEGSTQEAALKHPEGEQCINLRPAELGMAAFRVVNHTDATAVVFLKENCGDGPMYVLNPGDVAPSGVLVRSVIFSE